MDDIPITLENILQQAPRWTFAGDYTLLQWMKQISQDLESRALKTTEGLYKLDNNVKSTNIALDNVANRLTTLQFGNQFVECRVQDDDETLVNANNGSRDNQEQPEKTTSKELLNTFLDNNLKVLRNCHEKYSIDLEDSDDEENSKEKTCIYQPINPYNERPLPYIFGSKDWHSKWHVGLYENQQENSYSGDELSEAFSETSSTSRVDDNESFESNTEWASSNSIDNDNLNANMEVKNASSIRGSQALHSGTSLPTNVVKTKATLSESSSISTTSSSLAKKSLQTTKQNEHLTQRSESINSISSKNSSKTTTKAISDIRENALQYKPQPKKYVDLFAEPPEDQQSTASSSVSSATNIIPAVDNKRVIRKETPPASKTQPPPPFVDLFAEPPDDVISSVTSSVFSNQNIKRKPVNLFDEVEDNTNNNDLLSVLIKDEELKNPTIKEKSIVANKPSAVVKISKSLFDDSDEDDDFLKAFVKKSSPKETTKSSLTKTLLFDNEIHEPTVNSQVFQTASDNANNASGGINTSSKKVYNNNKIQNIFDDTEDNGDVLLFNKTKTDEAKMAIQNPKMDDVSQLVKTTGTVTNLSNKPVVKESIKKSVNEFNDFVDVNNTDNLNSHKISKKINLFDDLDDEDDLFTTKPKKNEDISQQTNKPKEAAEESEAKSKFTNKDDSNEITNNNVQDSNVLHNEEHIKPKEVVSKNHNIPSTTDSEITENKLVTESHHGDSNILSKESLFEPPNKEKYTQPKKKINDSNSLTLKQDTLASVPEDATQKPSSSIKYDFNSVLFSDEPPEDDDAFFETLTKTPSTLNSNYNAIDLENDIYEPELPKVPASSISSNQTDTTENLYTGLQLFSDIPPDDDTGGIDISNLATDVNQTKRLHSVFYDDFNETLLALNQQQTEKDILKHSILSDVPPPMDVVSNPSSKDVIDHKVADDKQEIINDADYKTNEAYEFSNKRPVSKLQMPNININIQALLPGANNNTLRKVKDDNQKASVINPCNDDIKPNLNMLKTCSENEVNISKTHSKETLRTAETEHILTHVTKNRVKAPAARRPSTRKARQENYQKSLLEEQQQSWESGGEPQNETMKTHTKTIIPPRSSLQEEPNNTMEIQKSNLLYKPIDNSKINIPSNATTTSATSKLFEDEHQSNHEILNILKNKTLEDFSSKAIDDSSTTFKEVKLKTKSKHGNDSLLFGDDEEDDDFFKHIKTSNILDSNKARKGQEDIRNLSAKSSLKKLEAYASNPPVVLTNKTDIENTKEFPVSPASSKVAPSEITTNEYKKNQTTQVIVTSEVKTPNQLATNKSKSFLDSEDEDNDLFKTTLQQPTSSSRSTTKTNNSKAKAQFKSFLDSETDEESTVGGLKIKTSTHSTEISNVSVRKQKNSNAKLFSDSETDSDDLFGKLSTNKTSKKKIANESKAQIKSQPQSSLFDSDESDSVDFLASSGSISKTTASKSALKKNVPKVISQTSNTSLFSDLDSDEEDLFGGAAAKVTATNVTNVKNVHASATSKPIPAVAEIPKSKSIDDNPLADLL